MAAFFWAIPTKSSKRLEDIGGRVVGPDGGCIPSVLVDHPLRRTDDPARHLVDVAVELGLPLDRTLLRRRNPLERSSSSQSDRVAPQEERRQPRPLGRHLPGRGSRHQQKRKRIGAEKLIRLGVRR